MKNHKKKDKVSRAEQGKQTYQRFLDRLSELIENDDIENFKIRDICASLGLSPRTFYLYFESKEQAILKYFEYHQNEFANDLLKEKARFDDPYQWLIFVLRAHHQVALDNPNLARQVYRSTLKLYDEYSISDCYPLFIIIRDALTECEKQGLFRLNCDARQAAWELINFSRGIQVDYFRRNESFDLMQKSEKLLNTYLLILTEEFK